MRLAAIDIGSNAARLLITQVSVDNNNKPTFTKLSLVRVPLRLGFDVFDTGNISSHKINLLLQTMKGFLNLSKAFEVKVMKACATSAMRDASNTADVISLVKEKTGIEIEVISGTEEASLVFENHIAENLDKDYSYLYIDVGGGSTDVTFFSNNAIIFKESFNIGTIRVLKNQVTNEMWNEMKSVIKSRTKDFKTVTAIGSGGNINKIFSLSKRKDGKPLTLNLIRNYYKVMNNISLEERTSIYKLTEDRADVIVPALKIYLRAMRWAGAEKIYVPKIGLADGLVQHLWEQEKGKEKGDE